jgi:hypothetical protein
MKLAYLAEGNRQHAFPVQALLDVRPAPVFSNGKTLAASLQNAPEVHVHPPGELGAALKAHGIDVVISTSQLLFPRQLKLAHPGLRSVFVGHGESDKTHDAQLKQRFVHNPVNEQFDLLLLASYEHFRAQTNPRKRLVGYLKHDLFSRRGYAARAGERRVLWAPGWGRHNAARYWTQRVVQATAALDLRLDIHLHPHSYSAEPDITRQVQLEMLRHDHVRVIQSADILGPMSRASLMHGDVSSVCYDWLLFDRPIVFLDHRGLAIAEEKQLFDVGVTATEGSDLRGLIAEELARPARLSDIRKARLHQRFFGLDGNAAQRALAEVERAAQEDWNLV